MHDQQGPKPTAEEWCYTRAQCQRGDLRAARAEALLCRLRGTTPRGEASFYDGMPLNGYKELSIGLGVSSTEWEGLQTDSIGARVVDFYNLNRPPYKLLAHPEPMPDLRETKMLRPGAFSRLLETGQGEEIREGYLPDGSEVIQLLTFARIFSVPDVVWVNDDVGLINRMAKIEGDAATFAENRHFFDVLLSNSGAGPILSDGVDFFHADHGNLLAGAALDDTSLPLAIAALRKQRTPGEESEPLNLVPRFLLCGPDYEAAALAAVRAITPPGTKPLEVIVHGDLSGQWYLFAHPRQRAAFVAGYLEAEGPGPKVKPLRDFRYEGIRFRVITRFAVGPYDPRACTRNPGP